MKMKLYFGALALIWLLSSCTPQVPSTVDTPRITSTSYKTDTVTKKKKKSTGYWSSPSQYNKRKSSYTNKRSGTSSRKSSFRSSRRSRR